MNIIAFIPARGGSKSIPKKNIKELGGKPLIQWSIEVAQKCGLKTIVDTDSNEIREIAESIGVETIIRPSSLAKDTTSMFEVLRAEIPRITPKPDLVLLLQPTSPFRKSIHIKTAISYLTENLDKYDSIISVEKVPEKYNPAQVIISTQTQEEKNIIIRLPTLREKLLSYFLGISYRASLIGYPISKRIIRRQEFPNAWIPDGSIYLFKTSNLNKGSFYGDKVMLMENEGTININTQEDWDKAKELCKNNQ